MHRKKHIWCAVMILLITAFDQFTKFLAVTYLKGSEPFEFIRGVVRFTYSENTGMAFSMFSGARWVFVALTVVVCVGILWYLFSNRCRSLWLYWSLGVVCAGGLGNLIDRIVNNYVVDFFYFSLINFPIFNVADIYVTVAAFMFIILGLFYYKEEDFSLIFPDKKHDGKHEN